MDLEESTLNIKQSIVTCLLSFCLIAPVQADDSKTIGWIEKVQIPSQDITFTAKIDTGADFSSLHATAIEIYEHNDSKRVRFSVENQQGTSKQFDLPLVRMASIKRKRAEPIERPVVSMGLCIGNVMKHTQINLANRGNFKYRMLIGRSYLKDKYLVHSGKQFTRKPNCNVDDMVMTSHPVQANG